MPTTYTKFPFPSSSGRLAIWTVFTALIPAAYACHEGNRSIEGILGAAK